MESLPRWGLVFSLVLCSACVPSEKPPTIPSFCRVLKEDMEEERKSKKLHVHTGKKSPHHPNMAASGEAFPRAPQSAEGRGAHGDFHGPDPHPNMAPMNHGENMNMVQEAQMAHEAAGIALNVAHMAEEEALEAAQSARAVRQNLSHLRQTLVEERAEDEASPKSSPDMSESTPEQEEEDDDE